MTDGRDWTFHMVGGGDVQRFAVSGSFRYKSDFDDFLKCAVILQSLADDGPVPEPAVIIPGGDDAMRTILAL